MTEARGSTSVSAEVIWYRKYGEYPNWRITRDRDGILYVIGDSSWNAMHKDCHEVIEPFMSKGMEPNK